MDQKQLIIVLLGVVIAILCCGIAYLLLSAPVEYSTINLADGGTTIEIPKGMAIKSNNNGIQVYENDNTIVITFNSADRSDDEILAFDNIKNSIFGSGSSGDVTVNDPSVAGCSLSGACSAVYISNNDTHDNIIVISKNKDIATHIINSVKWQSKSTSNDDSSSSSSGPTPLAYKSDGTPMYTQSEVDKYMLHKYGKVDYHIGDNGYIDMDEPGYDDAGHWIGY